MLVQAVNNRDYRTNFGAIIIERNVKFTEGQQKVVDSLVDVLKKPMKEFGNKSAEKFYEIRKGLNFVISSYDENTERIALDGYTNIRYSSFYDDFISDKSFKIGVYDRKKNLKLDEIKSSLKNMKIVDNIIKFVVGVTLTAGAIYLATASSIKETMKSKEIQKPVIENVDNLKNNVKSAVSSSTKVLKAIK